MSAPADAATPRSSGMTIRSHEATSTNAPTREELVKLPEGLQRGSAPRSAKNFAEGSQVAYHLPGATKFYERVEIKDALASVIAVANPADVLALRRIMNTPKRGIGPATQAQVQSFAESGGLGCVVAGGIGVTIVSILAAHGVCPNNETFRVYILNLEDQCSE
ncbi:3'-5' exonuclease [Rathayibacter toxicus]|uniref:3'-5' exonuclease n=2 Tax=Rathayibacter toxicus TaxID=145458 RepID=UPI000CE83E40|nr:hypothetical protein C5D35_02820 [Rathayibacter toxicus]QOD10036.1 hypothetical protein BSG36_08920 [Rathayibacter toxicus]QWL28713.1 hypothetical protein E2R33_08955 [Rathayibacter toxicus]QWL32898.1 hypothetical protein E2R35_08740 [Rathayibacter toxicus]QWL34992.1 hypothetical protein E2R36_08740 [Rathayibacter toxicus]